MNIHTVQIRDLSSTQSINYSNCHNNTKNSLGLDDRATFTSCWRDSDRLSYNRKKKKFLK